MIRKNKIPVALAAVLLLCIPTTASAQDGVDAVDEGAEGAEDLVAEELEAGDDERPWSVSGSSTLYAYQGLFVSVANDSQYAGEVDDGSGAYNLAVLVSTIDPSYQWGDFTFAGQIRYDQNLTAAGGINEPYEGRFQDINFSAAHSGYSHEGTGITVAPSFGLALPTSSRARAMTMIASTSLGARLSRTFFDNLTLSYGLTGSRTFHRYTSPVMNIDEVGEENAHFRSDGAEAVEPGRFAVAGINTPWGLVHSLAANMAFSDRLTTTISFGLSTGWSYNVARDDEYASEYQCSGRCAGRSANGRSAQLSSGSVVVDYTLNDNLDISAGIGSVQPPKKANNQSYNFPFWNFSGAAANYSSLSLGVTGSY